MKGGKSESVYVWARYVLILSLIETKLKRWLLFPWKSEIEGVIEYLGLSSREKRGMGGCLIWKLSLDCVCFLILYVFIWIFDLYFNVYVIILL